tara:strand:+ start:8654 stop:9205 length:552 start_codon:yes stop_codon:yes gene_type:complete
MIPLKEHHPDPDFETLISATRPRLHAFLVSLIGSASAADDLTQETCLVLWEKREEYDPAGDFRAWAFRIGFFQAKNYRRKVAKQQARELPGDDLFDQIAQESTGRHGNSDLDERRQSSLLYCLKKLTEPHRELLLSRYQDGTSLESLSSSEQINRNAMAQKLFRIKRSLLQCIEKQLSSHLPS